jgi:Flp pilus assembly protein TadD
MVNLADLYRMQSRDDEGERWLERAVAAAPDAAEPVHALGLLKVRRKQYPEALALLAKAAALQPGNARYNYVYAVALHSSGQVDRSIAILQQAHERCPADREVLTGFECGILLDGLNDLQVGDIVESYETREVPRF